MGEFIEASEEEKVPRREQLSQLSQFHFSSTVLGFF